MPSSRLNARSPVAVALLYLAYACASDESIGFDLSEAAEWHIDPEPSLVIGQTEGAPEYLFTTVESIHLLPDDLLVVSDYQEMSISIYDLTGEFQRNIGRGGEGPGEFGHLTGVWVAPPDTVHTVDMRLRRVSSARFS